MTHEVTAADADAVRRTIDAIWRIESAKIIARLTRLVGDVGVAEDLAGDALLAALEQWPADGIPDNPGAWLMASAKNRAIDGLRRRRNFDSKQDRIATEIESRASSAADIHDEIDDDVGDDLLRLMFIACHPVLSKDARVALTLRLLGGLTTAEIARAYFTTEPTIQQRIVRAKRTLAEARAEFELPRAGERVARVAAILEVIYLIFNEGYAATEGDRWARPELCEEALRLGRILAGIAPGEPEVHGLVALMEIQASRLRARVGASGEPVLLLHQDRSRWDRLLITRGLAALEKATIPGHALGPYALQAAIAACHARARTASDTDWERIVALYDALAEVAPSPVVELNRAVAVSMAFGPRAGLELVEELSEIDSMERYHLFHAVRGDMLDRLDRGEDARQAFETAASLTRNQRERDQLLERAARASSNT